MGEIRIEFKKDMPVYNSQEGGDMLTFERIRHAVMDYMPKDGIKKSIKKALTHWKNCLNRIANRKTINLPQDKTPRGTLGAFVIKI